MIKKTSVALLVLFLSLGIASCRGNEIDLSEVNPEAGVY
mgnify:FL=1